MIAESHLWSDSLPFHTLRGSTWVNRSSMTVPPPHLPARAVHIPGGVHHLIYVSPTSGTCCGSSRHAPAATLWNNAHRKSGQHQAEAIGAAGEG